MSLRALYDVAAPAKLNLFLHVIGRREDGYHLLQSVFVLIDWCDTLHFELRSDGGLSRHDLGAPLPDDDLCLRAAHLLRSESGCALGADISIDKQVPSGAGMGGGSSDAAATLLALNRLWDLNWSRARLQALGLKLGADVPFFVGGQNALVEGIGERLTPVAIPPGWLAVVKPPAGIMTRVIFGSALLDRNTRPVILEGLTEDGFLPAKAGTLNRVSVRQIVEGFGHNDLQAAAEAECVQVAEAGLLLKTRFGNSRMTGSGSAVFARAGSVEGEGPAVRPAMAVALAPGWSGRMCLSLMQHPLCGWAQDEVEGLLPMGNRPA